MSAFLSCKGKTPNDHSIYSQSLLVPQYISLKISGRLDWSAYEIYRFPRKLIDILLAEICQHPVLVFYFPPDDSV